MFTLEFYSLHGRLVTNTRWGVSHALPINNRRYSRLPVCATSPSLPRMFFGLWCLSLPILNGRVSFAGLSAPWNLGIGTWTGRNPGALPQAGMVSGLWPFRPKTRTGAPSKKARGVGVGAFAGDRDCFSEDVRRGGRSPGGVGASKCHPNWRVAGGYADCQSAIQQTTSLRYRSVA